MPFAKTRRLRNEIKSELMLSTTSETMAIQLHHYCVNEASHWISVATWESNVQLEGVIYLYGPCNYLVPGSVAIVYFFWSNLVE